MVRPRCMYVCMHFFCIRKRLGVFEKIELCLLQGRRCTSIMPTNSANTRRFKTVHHEALRARLRETIRAKHVSVKEWRVGKPVELDIKAEDECAICLDSLTKKNIAVTPCGHKFCFTCIAENLNVSKNCPMCREKIGVEAKKRTVEDHELEEIIYQNFDEAAGLLDDWDGDDDSAGLEQGSADGAGVVDGETPEAQPAEEEQTRDLQFSAMWDDPEGDDDDDDEADHDVNIWDSYEVYHDRFVSEFAREHLRDADASRREACTRDFDRMLSFAMHIASDLIDHYEK